MAKTPDPEEPPLDPDPLDGEERPREQGGEPSEQASGEEADPSTEALETRITELETQLEAAEDLAERRTNTLAKVQADFENYRKRAKRERQEAARDARIGLIKLLVEILDDVDRAKQAGEPEHPVVKGLTLVERKVRDRLSDLGVVSITPDQGAPFDPGVHEALMTVETDEQDPETIVEVLATGYELDGKLVRPAMVQVARGPVDAGEQ